MMFTTYDYTRTLMLKLDLAIPEPGGGCRVMCTFDQALEMVKQIDRITPGYQKVIYLVGWQYNGHDDRYPEFFEVNEHLKSPKDATARESLLRLVETAKNYHTVISYHINLSDAYPESAQTDRGLERQEGLSGSFGAGVEKRLFSEAGGSLAGTAPDRGSWNHTYRRIFRPPG